tara:strand:+ start:1708 stop:2124 length:417 start_codon:yes stop_codon:yes gene_type:complete
MINFITEEAFKIDKPGAYKRWILGAIENESLELGELSFLFCDDAHLHKLNLEFLNHDMLTDILTFEYNVGNKIYGDICISAERVRENAALHGVSFFNELARVMIHGVLHLCGYKDANQNEKTIMRNKEDFYLSQLFSE